MCGANVTVLSHSTDVSGRILQSLAGAAGVKYVLVERYL